jgi:hypothetical protein
MHVTLFGYKEQNNAKKRETGQAGGNISYKLDLLRHLRLFAVNSV